MTRASASEQVPPAEARRPSVTVVVPTRDRPQLLARAVASVLAQRYAGEIECLVVFDQSPVRLPALAVPARRRVRSLANDRAPGLAGARNAGAFAAEGDVLAFLDDDDEWLPDKLQLQVEALRSRPEAVLASCGIEVRYGGRRRVRVPESDVLTFADLLASRHAEIHPSTFLVPRATFFERIGVVDEQIPGSYAEDYEWLLRAARVGAIVCVRRPLVRIYWHRSSFFAARWRTIVSALTYLLERYPEFERDGRGLARIYGQLAFAHAAAGDRDEARRFAGRALRLSRRQLRAYLALLVSTRLVRAETLLRLAHLAGRGI